MIVIFVLVFIRLAPNDQYLPVLYIDQLGVIYRYLKVHNYHMSTMLTGYIIIIMYIIDNNITQIKHQ